MIKTNPPRTENSQVLIIGGSGYLGCYIVKECLKQGYCVTLLTRNIEKSRQLFLNDDLEYITGDISQLNENDYVEILSPFQKLIFAAGADERSHATGNVTDFYTEANIIPCQKLFKAAQNSPIENAVLLSSIFATIDRQHPELKLAQRHPYIQSRVEQNSTSHQLSDGHFILTTLEIPWVFGKAYNHETPWKSLIDYSHSGTPLYACNGGTNVIAASSVAQAVVNSLNAQQSATFPIGDLNLSYKTLLAMISGQNEKKIHLVADEFLIELMHTGDIFKKLFNFQSGLDTKHLAELLLHSISVDNSQSQEHCYYETEKAEQAIEETVRFNPKNIYNQNWKRYIKKLKHYTDKTFSFFKT